MPRRIGLLICLVTALSATETNVRDLSLDVELLPGDFSFTYRQAGSSDSADDSFDSAYGLAAGAHYGFGWPGSRHGVVCGAQLTYGLYSYDAANADYTTYGIRLSGGYSLAINDRLSLIAEPMLEVGLADFEVGGTNALPGFTADGNYLYYGAQTRLSWAINDNLLINGHLGYLIGSSDLSVSGEGNLDFENQGLITGLGITWRWSALPPRLE